jgi:trimeric autotransporter adhesin
MQTNLSLTDVRPAGLRSRMLRGALSLLVAGAGFMSLSQSAVAAAPPAGTAITNIATATYTDAAAKGQKTQSNSVSTQIAQVGSYSLTPSATTPTAAGPVAGNIANAASGGTISLPYSITNLGNGSDNFTIKVTNSAVASAFSSIQVYPSVGGQVSSTPLAGTTTVTTAAGSTTSTGVSIPAGTSYAFVITYTLPLGAVGTSYNAQVDVSPVASIVPYTPSTLSRTDTVSITNQASFTASKVIGAPAVLAAGNALWGATPASGPRGTTTAYTITYTNSGAANGNIYIRDVVPAGMNYVAGSAIWSGAGGTALGDGAGGDPVGIDFLVTGSTLEAVVANVVPGQSGTLSFKATVAAGATLGVGSTSNKALYSPATCAGTTTAACSASTTNTTGNADFTVLGSFGVRVGVADTTPGIPALADQAATFPTGASAKAVAGNSVRFTIPVTNTGADADTFKVSASATLGGSAFTATYNWYAADGLTPLQNTSGGTGVDTGSVAAGSTVNVVVEVNVPAGTAATATSLIVTAVATSVGDSSKLDGIFATITSVLSGVVDLTDNATAGALGAGAGSATVLRTIPVTAGGTGVATVDVPLATAGAAVFDLVVANNDTSGTLVFNLSASQSAAFNGILPAGWTSAFYSSLANATSGTSPITTVSVASGASSHVFAKITAPAAAANGLQDIYFQVASTTPSIVTGQTVSDYLRDVVSVTASSTFSFSVSPGANLQVAPAADAIFPHTLINTGSQSCGAVGFTISGLPTGWVATFYLDNGTSVSNIDAGDTILATGASLGNLLAAGNIPVLLKVTPSAGAIAGDVGSITLTFSSANCGTQTVTDIANIVKTGQVQVDKLQRVTALCANPTVLPVDTTTDPNTVTGVKPGACIVYKVVVTNTSSANITNVSLNDTIPPFTTYYSTQPAAQCATSGGTGTVTLTAPASTASGSAIVCGVTAASPTNTLPPGGTITLSYTVQIDQ